MIDDSERREVARRLREIDVGSIGNGYELLEEVANCIGCEGVKYGASYGQFVILLADLIEPQTSEQTNHDESSSSASPIDRDELLALADEIDADAENIAGYLDSCEGSFSKSDADEYYKFAGWVNRIREALGVES